MYELQFHPANIRKQVRYFFLARRTVRWIMFGVFLLCCLLITGAVLAPLGIQSMLLSSKLHLLRHQNKGQRDILEHRKKALEELHVGIDAARTHLDQMSLILGAPQTITSGTGGFPEPIGLEIDVPAAQIAVRQSAKLQSDSMALLVLATELEDFAHANQELTEVVPSICPIPIGSFVLTSPFGNRTSPFTNSSDHHAGIDLAARVGTPVMASGDGHVIFAGRFNLRKYVRWWRYGNVVVIGHGQNYLTIYAHLEDISVTTSAQVRRGETVGTVGNTGWSTSPHLHYEVRVLRDGHDQAVPVDPRIYILNYRWKDHETMLINSRRAPAQSFDPLPSRINLK